MSTFGLIAAPFTKRLSTILVSGGSVSYAKSHCERCGRKFRFWRKCVNGFNRTSEKFIEVCRECVTEDDAV